VVFRVLGHILPETKITCVRCRQRDVAERNTGKHVEAKRYVSVTSKRCLRSVLLHNTWPVLRWQATKHSTRSTFSECGTFHPRTAPLLENFPPPLWHFPGNKRKFEN